MFCEGTESRFRIQTCRADGLSRDLSMTSEERKRTKAVKKIGIAVRKAVDKGVGQKVVEDTVRQAIAKATEKVAAKKEAVKKTPPRPRPYRPGAWRRFCSAITARRCVCFSFLSASSSAFPPSSIILLTITT